MLVEYALIPDILDLNCYSSPDLCEARLQLLKPILLEEALVRDLRGGEWWDYIKDWIKNLPQQCHPKAKELLKKLKQKERIRTVPFCGPKQPDCHTAWLEEALASHDWQDLAGVITSTEMAQQYREISIVTSIERLNNADWLERRGSSIELRKQCSDYLNSLRLILNHANSILFIDPYLDPTQPHYSQFHFLLRAAKRSDIAPLIEIHVAAKGFDKSNGDRSQFSQAEWRSRFNTLCPTLREAELEAEIFVWEYFHDRYIISNIAGITLSSGLDVSSHANATVIWSRLSHSLRDKIQRDFDPNTDTYELRYRFNIK